MSISPILVEQSLVGIKSETTYGTAVTPGATDFIYASSIDLKVDTTPVERNYRHQALNNISNAPGSVLYSLSFETEYQYSGSGGVVLAPYDAIEKSAGLYSIVSAGTDVSYKVESTASGNMLSPGTSATVDRKSVV